MKLRNENEFAACSGALRAEGGLYSVLSGRGGDHGAHAHTQGLRSFQVHNRHGAAT
jgi:hypothetical protein